jgi:hypothetical protein
MFGEGQCAPRRKENGCVPEAAKPITKTFGNPAEHPCAEQWVAKIPRQRCANLCDKRPRANRGKTRKSYEYGEAFNPSGTSYYHYSQAFDLAFRGVL